MPIYMDIHLIPGVTARGVAEAHQKDLFHEDEYGCKCMTYWIDEQRENVFCLIDAPDKETVMKMHSRAHGLIPSKIIEVSSGLVESFLGRIYDPSTAQISDEGLKIFSEPSLRFLLVMEIEDPVLLQHTFGVSKTSELLNQYNAVTRQQISLHEGSETDQGGIGFIISFVSASKAIACVLAIQKEVGEIADIIGLRMTIHAGEPVNNSERFFGETIELAQHICSLSKNSFPVLTSGVHEAGVKALLQDPQNNMSILSPADENFIQSLFTKLDTFWQNPEMKVTDLCMAMAMSKSQLYRKTIQLAGKSPNDLLQDYRLNRAKQLLKERRHSIAQITFDAGFTSPSYFTKCFKKKFGLLPMAYIDMLG